MVYLRSKDYDPNYYVSDAVEKAEAKIDYYLINAFREGHGCSILGWSSQAAQAAEDHSEDMAENNYFAHISLDGLSPKSRMREQGITTSNAGENLAAGYQTILNDHNGLVNSAGHRQNILSSAYQYVGVGVACETPTKASETYVTEDYYC